ncbi:ferritin-like domain-containing protein [Frankia sp. AgPm24]|uniref:ferritin-like domain-containing protein n=1 Tax=Frankia sp. AgPm24 TaxID=631128 RepID=UPI0020103142|nr:ferritin-like domain-containing protein [Frankia sp. AgPm24]MCK9921889.1 ferritin-like domain-containing protein [Frankia sp. AgPm24]
MPTATPETAHSFEVFTHYERLQWKVSDLDLDNIRRDLVQPAYIPLVKGVVMGEATSLPGLHGFLSEFDDDYDCSAFVAVWAYQELQHHYAFRAWLRGVDVHIDQARIEALREPYEAGVTPSATLTTNVISEIIVNTVYRALSEWVEEPVLADLFLRASRDEAGHAREFLYYLKRRLEQHPHELKSVLERIHFYVTSARLNHPVGVYKHQRVEQMRGYETVDDVIDVYLQISAPDALDKLQAKLRRMLGTAVGLDLSRNSSIRGAMADLAAAETPA